MPPKSLRGIRICSLRDASWHIHARRSGLFHSKFRDYFASNDPSVLGVRGRSSAGHDQKFASLAGAAHFFSPSRRQIRSDPLPAGIPQQNCNLVAAVLAGQCDNVSGQPLLVVAALRDLALRRAVLAECPQARLPACARTPLTGQLRATSSAAPITGCVVAFEYSLAQPGDHRAHYQGRWSQSGCGARIISHARCRAPKNAARVTFMARGIMPRGLLREKHLLPQQVGSSSPGRVAKTAVACLWRKGWFARLAEAVRGVVPELGDRLRALDGELYQPARRVGKVRGPIEPRPPLGRAAKCPE
jgi:hypothetical protein